MRNKILKSPAIYIQALVALLLIQMVHKIVREIPGSFKMGGFGAKATPVFAILLLITIILLLFRKKIAIYIGIFCSFFMIFQPILVHIIWKHPDQNGIWWYPVFPWLQSILIIYFGFLTLKNEKKYYKNQKPMPWFSFQMMKFIMTIVKRKRNINKEVSFAGIKEGDYVLDFGCGLGFNTIPAAQKVGKNGRVYGLDLSKLALKEVSKKSMKSEVNNIELINSGCETSLDDNFIDIVYLHNTLPIVKNKEKVLRELTRVLKAGGKLSYTTGRGAKVYGNENFSNEKLKEYLNKDFDIKKEDGNHIVFVKK